MRLKRLHQFPRLHRSPRPAGRRERVIQSYRPVPRAGEDISRRRSGVGERVDGVWRPWERGDGGGGEGGGRHFGYVGGCRFGSRKMKKEKTVQLGLCIASTPWHLIQKPPSKRNRTGNQLLQKKIPIPRPSFLSRAQKPTASPTPAIALRPTPQNPRVLSLIHI